MIGFWIAAAGLSAVVAALVLREAAHASLAVGDDASLAVHRRQLSEIDDLAERGLLGEVELKAARAEAGRRLLHAADHQDAWPIAGPKLRPLVLAAAALAPLMALCLYVMVGTPGLADQPFLKRIAQWRDTPLSQLDAEKVAAVLQETAKSRPDDPQLLRLLAMERMQSGDASGAAQALRHAVSVAPDRVDLWVELGQVFVAESNGEIGADAQRAFSEALKRDPTNVVARYHLGKARIAQGDVAGGLSDWRALLASLPADDPRRSGFGQEIAQVERQGGLAPVASPATGQPAEVQTMIQGMVDSLAARLEAAPDDPDGWVRLVRAYAVLGDSARRDATLAKANLRYKDQPKVLAALRQAAQTPKANTAP